MEAQGYFNGETGNKASQPVHTVVSETISSISFSPKIQHYI